MTGKALEGFFAVETHHPSEKPAGDWQPLKDLALAERIAEVRASLAAMSGMNPIEVRVAASVAHLGLVARLIAPTLAAALEPLPITVDLQTAWWQPHVAGPYPLSVATSAQPSTDGVQAMQRLMASTVAPLTEAPALTEVVSSRVLWGNVASAMNSAATQYALARPAHTEAAAHIAQVMLSTAPLNAQPARPGPEFRRQSCCLIYRIAPSGPRAVCGDCVLAS